jgi:hypothetical protein
MKKRILNALALAIAIALLAPALGLPAIASNDFIEGKTEPISKAAYDAMEGNPLTANHGRTELPYGYLYAGKDGWYLAVTDAELIGAIHIAVKTRSGYSMIGFDINGQGDYWIGEGTGPNAVVEVTLGRMLIRPEAYR